MVDTPPQKKREGLRVFYVPTGFREEARTIIETPDGFWIAAHVFVGENGAALEGGRSAPLETFAKDPARSLEMAASDPFGVFRNLPGVMKWLPAERSPRRWGFRFWGVGFGERG